MSDGRTRVFAPDAQLLTTAGECDPDTAIMGGWIANYSYYENGRDVLARIARARLEANDMLENDTDTVLAALQETHYPELTVEGLQAGFELLRTFDDEGWYERWQDGTVLEWIGQVEQVFVDVGAPAHDVGSAALSASRARRGRAPRTGPARTVPPRRARSGP